MIDIKKIVFKDLDGKTQSTNFIKSINNKEVPESGDVVLDTIENLSVQGSKMKISKSNGSSYILELPAGFEAQVVDVLPSTGTKGIIYFVPKAPDAQSRTEKNIYEEYLWIEKDSTGSFEKIGDTQVDIQGIKDEINASVSTNYIKTVEVTSNDQTDEQGGTGTTYTFSFKNGEGTEISTASVVTSGGYSLATAEKDGLMSKADKAKLDSYELVTDAEIEALFTKVAESTTV